MHHAKNIFPKEILISRRNSADAGKPTAYVIHMISTGYVQFDAQSVSIA